MKTAYLWLFLLHICVTAITSSDQTLIGPSRLIHFTWFSSGRFVVESRSVTLTGRNTSRYDPIDLHICNLALEAKAIMRSRSRLLVCTRPLPKTTGSHPRLIAIHLPRSIAKPQPIANKVAVSDSDVMIKLVSPRNNTARLWRGEHKWTKFQQEKATKWW